jgi:hypothetical protein
MFEYMVLRRKLGPKWEEVARGWRRSQSLYATNNVVKSDVVHVTCMGEIKSLYKTLVGKPEGRRPLRGPKCRWQDNIIYYTNS